MNPDYIELGGILFGALASGWGCGFMVYALKRFFEQI